MFLAIALVFHLIIMPNPGDPRPSSEPPTAQDPHPVLPSIRTMQNSDLFKPFNTGKTFGTEAECQSDVKQHLSAYLAQRGLPVGAGGNFDCSP
jgi:hypothetical protein